MVLYRNFHRWDISLDKKTERYLEQLAKQNASRDIAEVNRKTLRRNITQRDKADERKVLEEQQERQELFNFMRRREN